MHYENLGIHHCFFTIGYTESKAQNIVNDNCGVNSVVALAQTLGIVTTTRSALHNQYPTPTVSLRDVKAMCSQMGILTSGVKAQFSELLSTTPCIIGLRNPDHFTLMLDGTADEVRLIEGQDNSLMVVPRRDIEARFTGFALVPELKVGSGAPHLEMAHFDKYLEFAGVGQKAEYHFSIQNKGQTPLEVEIANTSCGCTAAVLDGKAGSKTTLKPNGKGEVVVFLQVETQAPIQQIVTLKTNDPRHPQLYLSVRGQLPTQLAFYPPALYVSQKFGENTKKVFKFTGPLGTQVQKVWSDLPFLFPRNLSQKSEGVKTQYQIGVDGFSAAPVGPINGKIWVRLGDGKDVFVTLHGEIEGVTAPNATQAALLPRVEDDATHEIAFAIPTVKIGETSPDFTATDSNNHSWNLFTMKGKKNLLLTFFPKCFTGGCANHLSSLRDKQSAFDATNTQILAVSVDAAESEKGQKAFASQWRLTFPLIPDEKRVVSRLFGAAQNDKQLAARMTILIDKRGVVRFIDTNVNVQNHGADMLAKIHELGLDAAK